MDKTKVFIEKARLKHGDRYDYSKVEYVKAIEKVIIICKIHGEFDQIVRNHLSGSGCSKCGGNLKVHVNDFIEKAKKVHGDLYNYSKVAYVNNSTKVIIVCNIHGEYEKSPTNHLSNSQGCPICASIKLVDKLRSNTIEFIEKAKIIHGNLYNYSKVKYINAIEKVVIICNIHGEFLQAPNKHLQGSGCSKCNNNKSNTIDFIKKAKAIHGDIYDYSKANYVKSKEKIIIICKIHGEFNQRVDDHLQAKGCYKCGTIDRANSKRSNTIDFIEASNKIHGGQYNYSKTNYMQYKENIIIICKKHGEFLQTPTHHMNRGQGCPKCAKTKKYSKAQIQWLEFLEKFYNIQIQHMGNSSQEFKIKSTKWKADGYCEATNTIYEYHGDFWHGNPKVYDPEFINPINQKTMGTLYANTLAREQKIRDLGYNLVVMWESDWKKINQSIKIIQYAFRSKH